MALGAQENTTMPEDIYTRLFYTYPTQPVAAFNTLPFFI